MCPPAHFAVTYAINPWMHPGVAVDVERALAQWDALRRTYVDLGHRVDLLDPVPGLPDMVYAANGATVVDGVVYGARFRYPERGPEAAAHRAWFRAAGYARVVDPEFVNEGEGDLLVAGGVVLAGSGFRTDPRAHAEAARVLHREVVPLELVDPRFYHLDTALAVLDATTVAWFPGAFSPASRAVLADRYPDAVIATAADAAVLGLNAVSDGRHVVLPAEATDLSAALAERGFVPVPVEMSELLKGGGGPKCCTLEVRP
jgi:N-dimethylarginine dimethylaminohydrolase